jgi:hypothetical protein
MATYITLVNYTQKGIEKIVSVHRAPHLLCCRALEVQKYVCAPDALHLRHPVNAYNYLVSIASDFATL